tara:strand:+ start:9704 stop:10324 length:621 start_codon:yes stop_codon:yes gene_type:complete
MKTDEEAYRLAAAIEQIMLERKRNRDGQFQNESQEGANPETFKKAYSPNWSKVAIGGAAIAAGLAPMALKTRAFGGPGILNPIKRSGHNAGVRARMNQREDTIASRGKTSAQEKDRLQNLAKDYRATKSPGKSRVSVKESKNSPRVKAGIARKKSNKNRTSSKKKTPNKRQGPEGTSKASIKDPNKRELAGLFDTIQELHARIIGL